MNELVDSDPELYAGDTEHFNLGTKTSSKKKEREKLKADIQNHLNNNDASTPGVLTSSAANDAIVLKSLFDPDEISLLDPEDEREIMKEAKE